MHRVGLFDFANSRDGPAVTPREARWQSGHAAACKAVYAGSIPTLASNDRSAGNAARTEG
jgi:hypothetical protein